MLELFKFALFVVIAWTLFMSAGIAATLVGVVLAFGVIYWLGTMWNEEYDDDDTNSTDL